MPVIHPEIVNEYRYIEWCIITECQTRIEAEVDPYSIKINEALNNSNWCLVRQLESEMFELHQQIWSDRSRKEDILKWLKMDTQLRKEGSRCYADIMEHVGEDDKQLS
ncbi:MAG TPA: hypothetical protein VK203_10850 [Nostocaceae cyanobacterium]|nr:hypothetical protein [Nostocaceae cyanobacterium]